MRAYRRVVGGGMTAAVAAAFTLGLALGAAFAYWESAHTIRRDRIQARIIRRLNDGV